MSRREQLHELDRLLGALEEANLSGRPVADDLIRDLVLAGVDPHGCQTVHELLDQIWTLQEPLLATRS